MTTPTQPAEGLPELPEPMTSVSFGGGWKDVFNADQMRAYAREAIASSSQSVGVEAEYVVLDGRRYDKNTVRTALLGLAGDLASPSVGVADNRLQLACIKAQAGCDDADARRFWEKLMQLGDTLLANARHTGNGFDWMDAAEVLGAVVARPTSSVPVEKLRELAGAIRNDAVMDDDCSIRNGIADVIESLIQQESGNG